MNKDSDSDKYYIISGSYDHTIRIWDLDTGLCERVLYGHAAPAATAATETGNTNSNHNNNNNVPKDYNMNYPKQKQLINKTKSSSSTTKEDNKNKLISLPIKLRPVHKNDKDYIKSLHEGWFPVRYNQDFYESIVKVNTKTTNNNNKIVPFVAEIDIDNMSSFQKQAQDNEDDLIQKQNMHDDNNTEKQSLLLNDDNDNDDDRITKCIKINENQINDYVNSNDIESNNNKNNNDNILGCIVGSFVPISKCSKHIQTLLFQQNTNFQSMFYIMTLGTVPKYRHLGLGSILVNKCVDVASNNKECGVIYLHVIKYNIGAIKFYEKLGFRRITEIKDYYVIDGTNYNCYLYAKFLNGAYRLIILYMRYYF